MRLWRGPHDDIAGEIGAGRTLRIRPQRNNGQTRFAAESELALFNRPERAIGHDEHHEMRLFEADLQSERGGPDRVERR